MIFADPYTLPEDDTVWFRATASVSLSSTSFDMDGEPTFHNRLKPLVTIHMAAYRVLKLTPKGAQVEDDDGRVRFVLRDARKRWACPTREEAAQSLKARQQRRKVILTGQMRKTQAILDHLNEASHLDWGVEKPILG